MNIVLYFVCRGTESISINSSRLHLGTSKKKKKTVSMTYCPLSKKKIITIKRMDALVFSSYLLCIPPTSYSRNRAFFCRCVLALERGEINPFPRAIEATPRFTRYIDDRLSYVCIRMHQPANSILNSIRAGNNGGQFATAASSNLAVCLFTLDSVYGIKEYYFRKADKAMKLPRAGRSGIVEFVPPRL